METAIYITSVLITILWSVWNYRLWTTKAQLREESIFRFVLIMGPSAYLLVCLLAGWRGGAGLRLDLLGIIVLDIVMLFCSLLLGIGQITPMVYKTWYITIFVVYNVITIAVIIGVYVLRVNPVLAIRLSGLLRTLSNIRFFSFEWIGFDAEKRERDVTVLLNRVIIAMLSYIPVAVLRYLSGARQRIRLQNRIDSLEKRLRNLENDSDL